MRHVETVSVSLEPEYVELLRRVARKAGSKSAAVRQLLDRFARDERLQEMEAAYREYYSDPANRERDRGLTEGLLSVASWPAEGLKGGRRGARRRNPKR
ncbi:MAG TPA: hypothetical protein VJB14_16080 [Planctomycetota bacterium]|nr:hypothetical protein [Planctomycetota bacterium]